MIKHINKNIEIMNHNDNLVNKVMYMDSLAYERLDGESGYTPTPPSEPKFYATYSDGRTYTKECDGNSTLVHNDVKPNEPEYDFREMVTATVGNCVDTLGDSSLYQCSGVTTLYLPDTLTTINPYSMTQMKSLTNLDIPSSVTYIGNGALSSLDSLTGITIPSLVTFLGGISGNSLRYIILEPITPPILNGNFPLNFTNNCRIYVPDDSLELYKEANGWKNYKTRIHPLSEYQG